jgi:hypothetical protein
MNSFCVLIDELVNVDVAKPTAACWREVNRRFSSQRI